MTTSDLLFRDKVPVGILGATGIVGQKFIELLARHPWFEITTLAASERSVGKPYKEAVKWHMSTPLPHEIAEMRVSPCKPDLPCALIFSSLDAASAGEIEVSFAQAGYSVISNSRSHRMNPDVPLIIPEVNSHHLDKLSAQKWGKGKIVTVPNCSAVGLSLALKPLIVGFGVKGVHVVTFQAISGAGYPGVASLDILDNIIPFIEGEEHKVQEEPLKILDEKELKISAQCNRVPVSDGHLQCVSVSFKRQPSKNEIVEAWQNFSGEPQSFMLPSAPLRPLHYFEEENYPQPKLHRLLDKGMAVSLGRLKECPLMDNKFVLLSHNTIRGAAGGAILTGELMVKKGHIYW